MITKNYIKMCEMAEEIQKSWNPKFRDYCREKEYEDLMLITQIIENHDIRCFGYRYRRTGYGAERYLKNGLTWLPTQEQLQEIVDCNWYKVFGEFLWWHSNSDENAEEFASIFYSFNEVWLAFVMKEKYHKTWTGEKWVKAE